MAWYGENQPDWYDEEEGRRWDDEESTTWDHLYTNWDDVGGSPLPWYQDATP